jgi:hypothetical protein
MRRPASITSPSGVSAMRLVRLPSGAGHRPGGLAGVGRVDLEGRLVAVLVIVERGDHLDVAGAVVDGALHRELAHEHVLAGAGELAHVDAVQLHAHGRGVVGVDRDRHRAGGVDLGWQLDRHDLRQDGLVTAGLARGPGLAGARGVRAAGVRAAGGLGGVLLAAAGHGLDRGRRGRRLASVVEVDIGAVQPSSQPSRAGQSAAHAAMNMGARAGRWTGS